MAPSNNDQVGKALDVLRQGLQPFVQRELKSNLGERRADEILTLVNRQPHSTLRTDAGSTQVDCQVLLRVMWDQWNSVFHTTLSPRARNLVSELRDVRNRWAHQESFNTDDAYRAVDSAARLLLAVSARDEAAEVDRQKQNLLRQRFDEQAGGAVRPRTVRYRT